MYCRNCGKELDDQAVVCVGCGVPPLKGCKFCQGCGKEVAADAEMCTSCGVKLAHGTSAGDEKTWALLAHLSMLILGIIGPLLVWLIKGKESEFIDDQGKEALNFAITIALASIASYILMVVVVGFVLIFAVVVYYYVWAILAAIQANKGEKYRYPLCLRLVK